MMLSLPCIPVTPMHVTRRERGTTRQLGISRARRKSIENVHPIGGQVVGSIELFQPPARALLAKPVAFVLSESQEARSVSEHNSLDLDVIVSHGSQEKDHHVGKRPRGE